MYGKSESRVAGRKEKAFTSAPPPRYPRKTLDEGPVGSFEELIPSEPKQGRGRDLKDRVLGILSKARQPDFANLRDQVPRVPLRFAFFQEILFLQTWKAH